MSRVIATSKRPVWIVLAIALVIHTGLISLQGRHRIDASFVRVWILDSLTPLEKLVDRSTYGLGYFWTRYLALLGVNDENFKLKRENDELRMQILRDREKVLEAERLRALAGLHDAALGKTVVARVIGRDPARSQSVTIDKGMAHGLRPDSAVMTPAGIVGRVIHSGNFSSIVQLIVDSQSAVGVILQSTRGHGIVKGNGGRDLDLDYIDDDNDIKEGDTFLTSGEDRIYPKGFPVGVIVSIGPRRGLLKVVQIRPSADMGRLETVLCLVDHPQPIDVTDPAEGPTP